MNAPKHSFRSEDPTLNLTIGHAGQDFFSGSVVWTKLDTLGGKLQIYPGHEHLWVALGSGICSFMLTEETKARYFHVHPGFAVIQPDQITLFTPLAGACQKKTDRSFKKTDNQPTYFWEDPKSCA